MKPRGRKLVLIGMALAFVGAAIMMVLNAFEDNLVFFHTPTEVHDKNVPYERTLRVGGLVAPGSVKRAEDSTLVRFEITDNTKAIHVQYTGILPDLFREGQGVVAEGQLKKNGDFVASRVFARHDETYMPPEAAEALNRSSNPSESGSDNLSENKGY
ncbi:MAG: cytochrome c maturation protein CcmE [Hydrogenovibrio sp.]|uniref:cytochrome c maturation protein CcmE n=1 Tax=Hydrogenovibrio sp. TaxID=2065821 RepID=UPI00287083FB|nr:cytochrome c maturation protein CcmE [Hydrogenovibrio sp.]MDR9499901.1 cytochrome c maturation protein CcmE [Hydrogenovibrio sp.]